MTYCWVQGKGAAAKTFFFQDAKGRDIAYIREVSAEGFRYRANLRMCGIWGTEQTWVNLDIAKENMALKALEMLERDTKARKYLFEQFRKELEIIA